MSWFTDIAGKAEDFLNKIDQNAAIALSQAALENNGTSSNIKIENGSLSSSGRDSSNASIASQNEVDNQNNRKLKQEPDRTITMNGQIPSSSNGSSSSSINTASRSKSKYSGKKLVQSTTNKKSSSTASSIPHNNTNTSSFATTTTDSKVTLPLNKKSDDADLIAFLNDTSPKDLDENLVLKNAIANQAREIEMLFKNNRNIETENQDLLKKIKNFEEEKVINNAVPCIEAQVEKAEQETQHFKSLVMNKDRDIEKLKRSLDETLEKVQQVELLQETQNKMAVVEMEKNKLVQNNEELQSQISIIMSEQEASESYISTIKNSLSIMETEFRSYKEKAKSILKQKDDLIASLQEFQGGARIYDEDSTHSTESVFLPEINALKSERELLNAEISQSRATSDSLKDENHRLELEVNSLRSTVLQLQRTFANEKQMNSSLQEENLQYRQQVSVLQFGLEKEKSERRRFDELKLRSETEEIQSARASPFLDHKLISNNNDNDENLRTRITALSQSLLEKQSLINAISADKQLLQIHVERLQEQVRQMNTEVLANPSGFSQTVVSNQPLYLSESPWDSGMSMQMKRVYSTVDKLCCQAGVVLRRRPNLRLGFCAYIIILHFWVFFILFHSFSHVQTTNHPSNGPAPSPI